MAPYWRPSGECRLDADAMNREDQAGRLEAFFSQKGSTTLVIFAAIMAGLVWLGHEDLDGAKASCEEQRLCESYGRARQSCATAGNYKTCMDIKLSSERFDAADLFCNTDGRPRYPAPSPPTAMTCTLQSVKASISSALHRDAEH